ncbi:Holliday junction branch migration protein RuvA [Amphibacillus xylanus]|uniref:Holliday junction branch migration complex subunit RuvA n=1 Tax=Amphibacillus xylanus (strain ATCC 51415 / DSM 6626 / JCM 7361 / LMG 17667 / NBRC 15112 / Ep01) TaxID=698758 RepID=K0J231_AMPXN|nr:Holliday junction branch migration protein RuvA [Amphibacillus xylanus]BAM47167.1 Holliday junction ATP-dependent DNA helicase RuvA [Amphibacillus xylanus NBRC 15112]
MIAYVKGKLVEVTEGVVIVDVNGIGYEIVCANPFYFQDKINQDVKINTYHHVREDAQILYGFRNQDEKTLFSRLITVSGIGPKSGLSIVGHISVDDFVIAIENEDEKFLTQFPGVGKKTARQMILDLKGKLPFEIRQGSDQMMNSLVSMNDSVNQQTIDEAIEALKALGYSERELKSITPQLKQSGKVNADELIKLGLALLIKS